MTTDLPFVTAPWLQAYLQQLCEHWSHKLQVVFTAEEGKIAFPEKGSGTAILQRRP